MTTRSRLLRGAFALTLGASLLAVAGGASAQSPSSQGVVFFDEGKKLAAQGNWAEACPKFAEARRLIPDGLGILLNLADCYKHVGKTASAYSAFREAEFVAKKKNEAEREQFAQKEAAALEPRLSRLQINAKQTPGLVIRSDGQEIGAGALGSPFPADPGEHKIEATAPGYRVWSTMVKIGPARDLQTVEIPTLERDESARPEGGGPNTGMRVASFVVGGVGVAGIITGAVMGGLAASDAGKLEDLCPNKKCVTAEAQSTRASANTKAMVSTIGLVGGVALATTGVVLFVLSRGKKPADEAPKPSARLLPAFGPQGGSLTLSGSF